MVKLLLHILLIVSSCAAWAQHAYVKLEVSSVEVEEGEPFSILIKTNVDGKFNHNFPDELQVQGGVQSGMQSSIDYNSQKAVQFSYQKMTAVLNVKGSYNIGPIEVSSSKGVVSSNIIKVKVIEPVNLISSDPSENLKEAFFGIVEQSKTEVYEGEAFLLSSKLFAQGKLINLLDYASFKVDGPSEMHYLQSQKNLQRGLEKVQGKNIDVVYGGKTLVFPEKSGEFDILPFKMLISYQIGNYAKFDRKLINSNKSKIVVKPLPNKLPENFIGGVGNFSISCESQNKNLKVGDVFEYKVKISGYGNLHNIDQPKLKLPNSLSLYGDPEIRDSIFFTSKGAEGSIIYTYNIQVLKPEKIKIEGVKIAFFDPLKEEYITQSCKDIRFKAEGEKSIEAPVLKEKEPQKSEEKLKTILVHTENTAPEEEKWHVSPIFWTGVGTPISLAFIFGFFLKYRNENEEELLATQNKKLAKKSADQLLNLAQEAFNRNENESFYQEIQKALRLFLALKLNTDSSEISRSYLYKLESNNHITSGQLENAIQIFNHCDEARFSLSYNKENQEKLLKLAKNLINELNNVL